MIFVRSYRSHFKLRIVYSRNLGLVNITMAGTKNSELIKQVVIEMTIRAPKYFKGVKLDNIRGIKPTITESALMIIPRPEVLSVI